jgi:DNA-binding protein H-NS
LAQTDIQRFLEEEQERQARKQELIQELLLERDRQMAEFEEQLRLLGYRADVIGKSSGPKKEAGGKRERKRSETCSICGFATQPAHDGRLKAHRDQGEKKTALTDSQLEVANLKRV